MPWRRHTKISDTFFCLEGRMLLETREPEAAIRLGVGQRATVLPGQPHRVSGADEARCGFVLVQGVGEYDYLPEA